MLLDLKQFQAVLLDLDGTVYHEEHALPGAVEVIRWLQGAALPYACLTNSTSSPQRICARLKRMGVSVPPEQIYTAAAASCEYVMQRFGAEGRKPCVFNLATEGVHDLLDGKVSWLQGENGPCDAVIAGVCLNVYATEERQRTAMLLLRKGATLVGICADRVYPSPRGLEFGVGAMAALLAYAADVKPVFCGKPEAIFFRDLCNRLRVDPARCVLVGDNLESDIAGAKGVGMKTILTMGGVCEPQHLEAAPQSLKPDWVIEDLRELL